MKTGYENRGYGNGYETGSNGYGPEISVCVFIRVFIRFSYVDPTKSAADCFGGYENGV